MPASRTIPDACWQENRQQPGREKSLAGATSARQAFARGSVIAARITAFFPITAKHKPVKVAHRNTDAGAQNPAQPMHVFPEKHSEMLKAAFRHLIIQAPASVP